MTDKGNQKVDVAYCFIITSVIYSEVGRKVSYNGVRSVFTPEERSEQTKNTIESIKERVPNAKVVLIEAGKKKDLPFGLSDLPDQYIYVGTSKLVRLTVDSKIKSLGEAVMILESFKSLKYKAKYYFKMSGRYKLNENFDLSKWSNAGFTLYKIKEDYFCTRLYGFKGSLFKFWKLVLLRGLPFNLIDYPIEHTLAKFVPKKKITHLYPIGVSGIGASSSEIIKE